MLRRDIFQCRPMKKIDIKADASTDDGKLHIVIRNTDGNIIYRLDGEKLKDQQTLHVDKGSYIIQITADDHSEDVITIAYNIKISSKSSSATLK